MTPIEPAAALPFPASPTSDLVDQPGSRRALLAVVLAQFLSVLADNAILFMAIAIMRSQNYAEWVIPTLQQLFVASLILLAPFVGPLADAFPKSRVMQLANGLKIFGAALMLAGTNPLVAYTIIGVGAALYSTAKYAILTDIVVPSRLVKANGMLEGAAIAAILIGAVAGGVLADISITLALSCACVTYIASAGVTLLIPKIAVTRTIRFESPWKMVKDFAVSIAMLYRNKDAQFAIMGTSLFWGTGGLLRFVLVAWAPAMLLITTNRGPAMLNAMVALGIGIGAAISSRFITLPTINRALPAGISVGVLLIALMLTQSVWVAALILLGMGICGGIFMIPMDALLQSHGQALLGAGRTIAVQGFFKNILVVAMLGMYMGMLKLGVSVVTATVWLGVFLTLVMGYIAIGRTKNQI